MMYFPALTSFAWLLSSTLLLTAQGQHVLPRCAALCAMNAASTNHCFISDVSCLCKSTIQTKGGATCIRYACSTEDQDTIVSVLGTLCGQVLQLSRRDIASPSTLALNTAPSGFEGTPVTLTLTSILPPAGNRTQKVTQVYTTVVASGTAAVSSTLTSTASGITTVATSPTAAATATSAATGSFFGTSALLYLLLPILSGVFIIRP
ncbi:hypothetical protein PILCRDRAFT_210580 [Piloderma croceum F 1598]|uniref:CFEM domain-containing protein n=1 Tax=Piloderma croceum (strain F 1598) TaxID=765440 RepID=A0A0C3FXM7_PILCF|nr:hypothetical protein PILCRDRAFT_210580 [Piloderma croceum F 1598]